MGFATRMALSSASIFGAIVFSNFINDVNVSLLSSLTVTVIYQAILVAIGAVWFLVLPKAGADKPSQLAEIKEDEFEIKEIVTDGFEVAGKFGGKDFHENVKVIFKNGFEALYRFDRTITYDSIEKIDPSALMAGSLILEPGVVYVPVQ